MYIDGGPRPGVCERCRQTYMPTDIMQKYCKNGCKVKAKRTESHGGPLPCPTPHKLKYYSLDYVRWRIQEIRDATNNQRLEPYKCVCGDIHVGTHFPGVESMSDRNINKLAIRSGRNKN